MLLILNRYKIFFIILSIILLFLLIWLFVSGQENGKTPSRGVFVFLGSVFTEGRII